MQGRVTPPPWRQIDFGSEGIGTMNATSAGVAGVAPGPAAGQRVFLVSRRIGPVHALCGRKPRIHPEQRPSARCANLHWHFSEAIAGRDAILSSGLRL